MDPRYNFHTTNSKQWVFIHTQSDSNNKVIYAGLQIISAVEFRPIKAPITSLEGVIKILLTGVAYVPAFFFNILRWPHCRSQRHSRSPSLFLNTWTNTGSLIPMRGTSLTSNNLLTWLLNGLLGHQGTSSVLSRSLPSQPITSLLTMGHHHCLY